MKNPIAKAIVDVRHEITDGPESYVGALIEEMGSETLSELHALVASTTEELMLEPHSFPMILQGMVEVAFIAGLLVGRRVPARQEVTQ